MEDVCLLGYSRLQLRVTISETRDILGMGVDQEADYAYIQAERAGSGPDILIQRLFKFFLFFLHEFMYVGPPLLRSQTSIEDGRTPKAFSHLPEPIKEGGDENELSPKISQYSN